MIKLPVIVINFKAYEQGTGRKGLMISRIINKLSKSIILCPQAYDLRMIAMEVSNPVFTQSLEPFTSGAHTGSNTCLAAKMAGASGVLINHSENKCSLKVIKLLINVCRKHGLVSLVCAQSLSWVKKIVKFKPDLIAYEPPSLIGGKVSVSTSKPGVISDCVKACKGIPLLVGAGVRSPVDVKTALKLGAQGVLVASGVMKAEKPEAVVKCLIDSLKVT